MFKYEELLKKISEEASTCVKEALLEG